MVILAAAGLDGADSDLDFLSVKLIVFDDFGLIDLIDASQDG